MPSRRIDLVNRESSVLATRTARLRFAHLKGLTRPIVSKPMGRKLSRVYAKRVQVSVIMMWIVKMVSSLMFVPSSSDLHTLQGASVSHFLVLPTTDLVIATEGSSGASQQEELTIVGIPSVGL